MSSFTNNAGTNQGHIRFMGYRFSKHALWRMSQRNLTLWDVLLAIRHGQRAYRTGVVFCFLGHRDIPEDLQKEFGRLEGTTVILHLKSRTVLTAYRNRRVLSKIKRKCVYSLTREQLGGRKRYH